MFTMSSSDFYGPVVMGRCKVVAITASVRSHAQEHVHGGKEREIRKTAGRESEEEGS